MASHPYHIPPRTRLPGPHWYSYEMDGIAHTKYTSSLIFSTPKLSDVFVSSGRGFYKLVSEVLLKIESPTVDLSTDSDTSSTGGGVWGVHLRSDYSFRDPPHPPPVLLRFS